jgi:hypothetical protein
VFVQSKDRAQELFNELIYDGMNVDVIHSERAQTQVRYMVVKIYDGMNVDVIHSERAQTQVRYMVV